MTTNEETVNNAAGAGVLLSLWNKEGGTTILPPCVSMIFV